MEQIRHFKIEPKRNPGKKLQNGHFRSEPVPNRTELEADGAGPDHQKFWWRLGETERLRAADNGIAIKLGKRQFDRNAAGGDHDVFCFDLLVSPAGRLNGNFSRRRDRAQTLEGRDLVRLHQGAHAAGQGLDDLFLALLHFPEIDFGGFSMTMPCLPASFLANMK